MHEQGQVEFQQQTGIDIEQDIDYIVAAVAGADPHKGGLIVARGRFNDALLETLAREHGGVSEDYKGKRLVPSPATEGGHHRSPWRSWRPVSSRSDRCGRPEVDRRTALRPEHHRQR